MFRWEYLRILFVIELQFQGVLPGRHHVYARIQKTWPIMNTVAYMIRLGAAQIIGLLPRHNSNRWLTLINVSGKNPTESNVTLRGQEYSNLQYILGFFIRDRKSQVFLR